MFCTLLFAIDFLQGNDEGALFKSFFIFYASNDKFAPHQKLMPR
jgi:hypothetical protein